MLLDRTWKPSQVHWTNKDTVTVEQRNTPTTPQWLYIVCHRCKHCLAAVTNINTTYFKNTTKEADKHASWVQKCDLDFVYMDICITVESCLCTGTRFIPQKVGTCTWCIYDQNNDTEYANMTNPSQIWSFVMLGFWYLKTVISGPIQKIK